MPKGGKPGAVTVQTSFRFAPHVLVFPLVILLTLPVLRELLVSWNYWWYGTSYRRVTYVMDEFRPNSGSPYITGHFEGETDQDNLVGLESAGRQLVKALPSLSFSPGATVPVWYSPTAPMTVYFGEEANLIPVAARPALPGGATFATYLAAEAVIVYLAMWLTSWVFRKAYYHSGTLPVHSIGNPLTSLATVRSMAEEYSAAWCNRDAGAVASFFAPEGSRTINGGRPAKGRDGDRGLGAGVHDGLPRSRGHARQPCGPRRSFRVLVDAHRHDNSGPGGMGYPVKISGKETWRLNGDGDIVESQGRFDQADYDRQVKMGQTR